MSEITRGVIGMPFKMAMGSELSRRQFHSIAQALLIERDQLRAELKGLRTGFDAQNEVIAGLKDDKDALTYDLKVAHSVINSVHPDQERMDWIEENYTGHGGGTEFNLRLHLPRDIDDGGLRHAIDAAMGKGGEA